MASFSSSLPLSTRCLSFVTFSSTSDRDPSDTYSYRVGYTPIVTMHSSSRIVYVLCPLLSMVPFALGQLPVPNLGPQASEVAAYKYSVFTECSNFIQTCAPTKSSQ